MKEHLINTNLLVPRSRSSAKVKVKYQGNVSQKVDGLGAVVFHKHILFCLDMYEVDWLNTNPSPPPLHPPTLYQTAKG